ncbi:MAG: hypothetical protein U0694_10375 [Anaerolineae bacterium]
MKQKVVFAHILAVLAAWLGAWVVLPTIGSTLVALPQMALTEFPWIPAIFGAVVALWAWRKPRMPIAIVLSLIGVVLAIQPILQSFGVGAQLEAAMQAGLGADYAAAIPDTARVASARFSLLDAVGARNFGSQATVTENVEFFAAPERALLLDVYQPQVEPTLGDSYPAVIVIHGGSWRWLDKAACSACMIAIWRRWDMWCSTFNTACRRKLSGTRSYRMCSARWPGCGPMPSSIAWIRHASR